MLHGVEQADDAGSYVAFLKLAVPLGSRVLSHTCMYVWHEVDCAQEILPVGRVHPRTV